MSQVRKPAELIASIPRRQDGQSMAEYAVVLAVITIAVFAALGLLAGNIVNAISRVAGYIT
jgi:Flp pilus assembly pilin Flp